MASYPKRLFGTDGIRGLANQGPLEMRRVVSLGEAIAALLRRQGIRRPRAGLGWDTRNSSPALAAALTAGLSAGGAAVWRFGVMPTPAVARLTRHYKLDAGLVVSASHNPAEDNGIKYFSGSGGKFPDADERRLEQALARPETIGTRSGKSLGPVLEMAGAAAKDYSEMLICQFGHARLSGCRVAADLANGAVCRTAPGVLEKLGMRAEFLACEPDGQNINLACGSLHPKRVGRQVRRLRAAAGLAFDGDGDRVILTDEQGRVVNGDRMLGILAMAYARQGRLPGRRVVATVMSNLGLELFLKSRNIQLLRAQVGDRYVAQAMAEHGALLGGEQSGHILLPRLSPAGDGLLTALEVLAVMQRSGNPLSELAGGWEDFPQLLINIRVAQRPGLDSLPKVRSVTDQARQALGERGRINVRYSGTEPLVRVMTEAGTKALAQGWGDAVASAIEAEIGAGERRELAWLACA